MSDHLAVGQHVIVRDAFNQLKKAEVRPLPSHERDKTRSKVITSHGLFLKAWVSIEGSAPVPWPLDDIFTDLEMAMAAQSAHAEPAHAGDVSGSDQS